MIRPAVAVATLVLLAVFRTDDDETPEPPKPGPKPQVQEGQVDPVRVGVANGAQEDFSKIQKARAPFGSSEPSEADLVWDVGPGNALSRGDLIMSRVDGTVMGNIIDRTWAVRAVKKLSGSRIIDVKIGEDGRSYTLGDHPELVISDIRGSCLTVVKYCRRRTLQLLFPFYASHNPHITADRWSYLPAVDAPFGTDYTVAIATSRPATELISWLQAHNNKHDAFQLPAVVARTLAADPNARVRTAGLYTTP